MSARALLLALAAGTGCGELTVPERPEPYQYSFVIGNGLEIVFHWTPASLPVRVWAEPTADLPLFAGEAITLWEGVATYGEFRGVMVVDSTLADVIIRLGSPETRPPGAALACSGVTTLGVEFDTTITLPFRTTLRARSGTSPDEVSACLRVVTAHEIGHALGLLLHSGDADDLMYATPLTAWASDRDRVTFATLYHSPPTIRLPAGR